MDIWFRCLLLYLAFRFGNCLSIKEYRVDWTCPKIYGTKLDTVSSVSPLRCAVVCQMDERCISAYYYPSSRTCEPNLEAINSIDNYGCGNSPRVKYLSVSKYHCVDNTDCTSYSLNNECADGFCQCLNGYSLTPVTGACTTSCTRYGDTFRLFPSTSLNGFNNWPYPGMNTYCKDLCIAFNRFTCRTFQLNLDGDCQVSEDTAYLKPQAVNVSDPDWTLAQRNCA